MSRLHDGVAWLLGRRDVPFAVRGLYRREVWHMVIWGLLWGGLNGQFMGFVASKSLHASDVLVGLLAAAVAMGNILAIGWGGLMLRWPVRRVIVALLTILAALMFSFALTPLASVEPLAGATGRWLGTTAAALFTAQVTTGWIIMQAVNTARTHAWRTNYPRSHRARIVARFAVWQVLIGACWTGWMGFYFDGHIELAMFGLPNVSLDALPLAGRTDAYVVFMPVMGVAALIAAAVYARQRIRGEARRTAPSGGDDDYDDLPHAMEVSYSLPGWFGTLLTGVRSGVGGAIDLLRHDRRFAEYLAWQFLAGSATLMIDVPLVLILKEEFDVSYGVAAGLLTVAPQAAIVVFMPLWAGLFDRWPLMRFRTLHMMSWTVSRSVLAIGIWQRSLAVVAVSAVMRGVSLGAGRLSWQIGHMSFSRRENDAAYMSLHQTLTGIRGLVMPFLGLALFRSALGMHIVWITAVLQFVAGVGFWTMRQREKRRAVTAT